MLRSINLTFNQNRLCLVTHLGKIASVRMSKTTVTTTKKTHEPAIISPIQLIAKFGIRNR
eukprot:m.332343 g.332343  ORF g.332343 m.332343 type:complete len:60 (-) comp16932_c0_seq1:27-206(-)